MRKFINFLFLSSLFLMQSCILYGKKEALSLSTTVKQKTDLGSTLTSVNVSNNTVTIQGSGLSEATIIKIEGSGVNETLNIDSKSDTQIIASALNNFSLLVGATFNLIIGTADAQVTYAITFTLQDGAVTAAKIAAMGATAGQVLKYNGSAWAPASLNEAQIYAGTWNASNNTGGVPDLSTVSSTPGEYYIASHAGTLNGVAYTVGDWIISNGYEWQKVAASKTSVTSFQGRKGIVVLTPADYVSLKDTGTSKITGSSINDLADIDLSTAPTDGQVLVYETAGGLNKWIAGTAAAGGIALTDLSASSPLSYNNATGAFSLATADLLALPLTGLTSGSGALTATDTILAGLGKLMSVPSDYVSKSSGANMTTGTIALSGTAMITVPTATGVTATEVANVTYVNNAIAGNGVWSKGASSSINYAAGNVGIGITSPSEKLDVNGNIQVGAAGQIKSSSNWLNLVPGNGRVIAYNGSSNYSFDLYSANTLGVSLSSSANSYFNAGNVGIGTITPTLGKLHIVEAGATRPNLYVVNSDNSGNDLAQFWAQNLTTGVGINYAGIRQTATNGYLSLNANGTGKIYIGSNSTGNIAIGSSNSAAASKVSVAGNMSLGSGYYTTAAPSGGLIVEGNVGISTTSPVSKLHVGSAPTASANYGLVSIGSGAFDGSTSGYFGTSSSSNSSGTVLAINAALGYVGDLVNFQVNGVSKFKVDASGNVEMAGTLTNSGKITANGQGATKDLAANDIVTRDNSAGNLIWEGLRILPYFPSSNSAGGTFVTGSYGQINVDAGASTFRRMYLARELFVNAGTGGTMSFDFNARISFTGMFYVAGTSVVEQRIYVGTDGVFTIPYAGADAYPSNYRGYGFKVRVNPSATNQIQVALFARDGTSGAAGTYVESAWTSFGTSTQILGKRQSFVLDKNGTSLTLYGVESNGYTSNHRSRTSPTAIVTLSGAGVPNNSGYVSSGYGSMEAAIIGNNVDTNVTSQQWIQVRQGLVEFY